MVVEYYFNKGFWQFPLLDHPRPGLAMVDTEVAALHFVEILSAAYCLVVELWILREESQPANLMKEASVVGFDRVAILHFGKVARGQCTGQIVSPQPADCFAPAGSAHEPGNHQGHDQRGNPAATQDREGLHHVAYFISHAEQRRVGQAKHFRRKRGVRLQELGNVIKRRKFASKELGYSPRDSGKRREALQGGRGPRGCLSNHHVCLIGQNLSFFAKCDVLWGD